MRVRFIDTTFRDGSQSLWALRMTTGMMEAVAEPMDRAGFAAIELPMNPIYFKKFVRDHREDPWAMMRLMAAKMPRTPKGCMVAALIHPFELRPPRAVVELFFKRAVATGALNRGQVIANTMDQRTRDFPWFVPFLKGLGVQVAAALAYLASPRHTDAYYAKLTREVAAFRPDAIYLKDAGGLLTTDRLRTLLPAIVASAGGIPVELHSHCTTGMAPFFYLEAPGLGAPVLHTAIPPLAMGSGQPSLFEIARNLRLMGHEAAVDDASLAGASETLAHVARAEGLPIGAPVSFDYAQFVHQVPGGVISNLKQQLVQLGIADRLPQVLDEVTLVQRELGHPPMITPYSQFVVTQSALNVALGKRYAVVPDEVIRLALGAFGEDSGHAGMDPALKDRLLDSARARELAAEMRRAQTHEPALDEVRAALGAERDDDETFLLRYLMKNDAQIAAMRAAGPHRRFDAATTPLQALVKGLLHERRLAYVRIEKGADSITLRAR